MKHTQSAARLITCQIYPCWRDNDINDELLGRRAHARQYRVTEREFIDNELVHKRTLGPFFRTGVPEIAQIHKEAAWAGSLL